MTSEWRYAIPTYNRPELIQKATLAYLERSGVDPARVDIWISGEAQAPLYAGLPEHWRARFRMGIKTLTGNRLVAERAYPEGQLLVWLNDDIFKVSELSADNKKLEERPIDDIVAQGFTEMEQARAHLWGVYAVANPFYMKRVVHRDLRYVVGCFFGVKLRADPFFQPQHGDAKEDYERALRFFQRDGAIVRMDSFTPKTIYYNSPEIFPDLATVERNIQWLEASWPQWVRRNTRKKSPYPEIDISNRWRARAQDDG